MGLLNSDKLLDLLISQRLLTAKQKQFVLSHKDRQSQQLLKLQGGQKQAGRGYPDMVDILASLKLELVAGKQQRILTEELIMRAVSRKLGIPFKKLDPLELDIEIVTKTIPRSFAINHLILPFEIRNGVLQVVIYDPDNKAPLQDIEQVNQTELKPYLSTRSDIRKILSEFFGFQRSITAAESQFSSTGSSSTVDIGNLEQYVKLSTAQELSSTDQHIKAAVNHLFNDALGQRASDIHVEPKRDSCLIRYRIDGILHT
ncbi:MAG: type II/IV secretion system protein, partial [Candidatus Electrothrix sp. AR5]|nr:type II/IV secretion system protein [Candidatus Electrothrix sp. AR5]